MSVSDAFCREIAHTLHVLPHQFFFVGRRICYLRTLVLSAHRE